MRNRGIIGGIIFLLCLLALAGLVFAQGSAGADFSADKIMLNYKKNVTTFWGTPEKPVSVQVDQYTVWAPLLEYFQDTGKVVASEGVKLVGANPKIELVSDQLQADDTQVIAVGNVAFEFEEFSGSAEKLTYLPDEERLILTGNPVVKTKDGIISGAVIEIDLNAEVITASGGSQLHLEEVERRD